ncbi:hypothetical protein CsatB_003268 [Cannabis sativa]
MKRKRGVGKLGAFCQKDLAGDNIEVEKSQGCEKKVLGCSPRKQATNIVTRSSLERISRVVHKLSVAQKTKVQEIGFGAYLREDFPAMCTSLANILVKRVDVDNNCLNLCGKSYPIFASIFKEVMALPDGPIVINEKLKVPNCELKLKIMGNKSCIEFSYLEGQLLESTVADDYFTALFVLVVVAACLVPGSGNKLCTNSINCVLDSSQISQYNWATHCFWNLYMYFKNVLVPNFYVDRSVLAISFWNNRNCRKAKKQVMTYGGYLEYAREVDRTSNKQSGKEGGPSCSCDDALKMVNGSLEAISVLMVNLPDQIRIVVAEELKKVLETNDS